MSSTARVDFPARFTRGALEPGNGDLLEALRRLEPLRRHRVLFLLDAGLAAARPGLAEAAAAYPRAHRSGLVEAAPPVLVDPGARGKARPELVDWLRARIWAAGLGPGAHVVVVGGCALQDVAGFAAATAAPGLRVTRVASTVSAQAGGCTALRASLGAPGRVDSLGCAAPPFAALADAALLGTLDYRRRAAGLARVVRAALSCDAELFHFLCDHAGALRAGELEALEAAGRWSLRLHVERLSQPSAGDPWSAEPPELGARIAARLEAAAGDRLLRGEALALGLAVDILVSRELCGLADAACEAALGLLRRLGLPVWDPALEAGAPEPPQQDVWIPLIRDLGQTLELDSIDEAAELRAVQLLKRRPRRHP